MFVLNSSNILIIVVPCVKKYKVLLEMSSSTFSMPFKELFAPFQRGMNVLVNA